MKKLTILLLLILPAIAMAQPSISFDAESHDFGIVNGERSLSHTFQVTNSGTEELVIRKLEAP